MLKSWFLPAVFLGVVVGLASGSVRDAFASCSVSYSGSVDTCTDGDTPDELNGQNMNYTRTVYWISTGQTGTITFVQCARPSLGKEEAKIDTLKPFDGTPWVPNPTRQSWRPPEPSLAWARSDPTCEA